MSFLISSVRRQLIGAFTAVSLVFMVAIVLAWTGSSKALMLAVALLAVLVAGVISLTLSRDFSRRINQLLDGIESLDADALAGLENGLAAIAQGDLTHEVQPEIAEIDTTREDEIGELARTFNGMVQKTEASVAAYNATTGKEVWRFHNVPEPGEPGNNTWADDSWVHGGASVWTTGSYDPDLNLTYWGTGNAGPDFDGDARLGDNLYCNSVVALDADTGKIKWHYQFSPHDERDWDAAQIPLLADIQWPGANGQAQARKVMMWGNRNGVFYVLDRTTGKFLLGKPLTTINWLANFDENGRPIWAEGKLPQAGGERVLLYPGVEGGTSWYSPSFSPRTGLFYVSTWDNYFQNVNKPAKPQPFVEGGVFGGGGGGGGNIGWNGGNVTVREEKDGFGAVRAFDPKTGEKKWEYKMTDITMAGVLSTATDVVFSGAHDGRFFALDARTGAELWKTQLAGAVYSGAMTYSVNGKQFVAVSGGNTLHVFALK